MEAVELSQDLRGSINRSRIGRSLFFDRGGLIWAINRHGAGKDDPAELKEAGRLQKVHQGFYVDFQGEMRLLLAYVCQKGDEMVNVPYFMFLEGVKDVHDLGGISFHPGCLARQILG
jgi:hypothetical protein